MFFSMSPRTMRCAPPGTSCTGSLFVVCKGFSNPGGGNSKPDWVVEGPLPPVGKPMSESDVVKLGGEATDPARLRVVPTCSSAEAREDEPAEKEGVMPVNEGDEACEALVDAEVALGEDTSGCDGSAPSIVARRGSIPYMAA
ncbi:hypothetical protein BD310DRAFT_912285 [Dichomitus squalens]|uniref:Uncharacterized protein n=1 Tax=Dichomitus squalens TaxID=114155 RepID=A0A4Q9QDJ3_9APHY|nr:hypothetical protein BD310DRAFT_912285 [Dichomitus squalens]